MTNKSEWLPWTELPKRSNITPYELIDWLRYRAIEFGAPPLFIDAIEGLGSAELSETATAEIQELENQLTAATDERDELKDAVQKLLKAIDDTDSDPHGPFIEKEMEAVQAVLDSM